MRTIELDCAPGMARPGDYIEGVVEGTILEGMPEARPNATSSRFFGNWTWSFPNISDEAWAQIQTVIKPRIIKLYEKGLIRYGSW